MTRWIARVSLARVSLSVAAAAALAWGPFSTPAEAAPVAQPAQAKPADAKAAKGALGVLEAFDQVALRERDLAPKTLAPGRAVMAAFYTLKDGRFSPVLAQRFELTPSRPQVAMQDLNETAALSSSGSASSPVAQLSSISRTKIASLRLALLLSSENAEASDGPSLLVVAASRKTQGSGRRHEIDGGMPQDAAASATASLLTRVAVDLRGDQAVVAGASLSGDQQWMVATGSPAAVSKFNPDEAARALRADSRLMSKIRLDADMEATRASLAQAAKASAPSAR